VLGTSRHSQHYKDQPPTLEQNPELQVIIQCGVTAMSRNTSKLVPDAGITVGELITELCRWPDHATIKFKCLGSSAELCFSGIESVSRGTVDIELHPATKTAPIMPARVVSGGA
jgi:hypothetical protein